MDSEVLVLPKHKLANRKNYIPFVIPFFQNIVGYEQRSFIEYRNLTVQGRKSQLKVLEQDSFLSWIGEWLHLILPL